jgi:hypothetical protein
MLLFLKYDILEPSFNGPGIGTIGIDTYLRSSIQKDRITLDISIHVCRTSLYKASYEHQ